MLIFLEEEPESVHSFFKQKPGHAFGYSHCLSTHAFQLCIFIQRTQTSIVMPWHGKDMAIATLIPNINWSTWSEMWRCYLEVINFKLFFVKSKKHLQAPLSFTECLEIIPQDSSFHT